MGCIAKQSSNYVGGEGNFDYDRYKWVIAIKQSHHDSA